MEERQTSRQTRFIRFHSLQAAWLLALALAGPPGTPRAQSLPLDPVCFPLAAEVATLGTNLTKVGFPEFAGHVSTPPKFYLSKQLQHYRTYCYSQHSGAQLSYYNYLSESSWDTLTYDPSRSFALGGAGAGGCRPMDAPTSASCYGYLYQRVDKTYGIHLGFVHKAQRAAQPPGAWDHPDYVQSADQDWRWLDESFLYLKPDLELHTATRFAQQWDYRQDGYQCRKSQIEALWTEYTTARLIDQAQFYLNRTHNFPPWAYGNGYARTQLSADEKCLAQFQKLRYRLKFLPPKDEPYRFTYVIRFVADDGGSIDLGTKTVQGIGTGRVIYYPSTDGTIVLPPRLYRDNRLRNGSTWLVLPRSTVCQPCRAGDFSLANNSVELRLNLGKGAFGEPAGWLILKEESPGPRLLGRAALQYFGDGRQVELLSDAVGLRQIKAPSVWVDLVEVAKGGYEIRCYRQAAPKGADGLYRPLGEPYALGRLEPLEAAGHRLRVRVSGEGSPRVYEYAWSEADRGWTLSSGQGRRQECCAWDQAGLNERRAIKDARGKTIYQESRRYGRLAGPAGLRLLERRQGPPGSAHLSQWFYYDQRETDGPNYGALRLHLDSEGPWERYQYDACGRLRKLVRQFRDARPDAPEDQCRVTQYDYRPVRPEDDGQCWTNVPRTTVTRLLGREIARQYRVVCSPQEQWELQCQRPGAPPQSPDNLRTVRRYALSGSQPPELQYQLNPDGTLQLRQKTVNPEGTQSLTLLEGRPNSNYTAILEGTRTTTLSGPLGEPIERVVADLASGVVLEKEEYRQHDAFGRAQQVLHLDGTASQEHYGCCGLESERDRQGTLTRYTYDELGQLASLTRNGIQTTYLRDACGQILAQYRTGSDGSRLLLEQSAYDLAGRLSARTNALGAVTRHTRELLPDGRRRRSTYYPDGGVRIETYHADGQLERREGSAVPPVRCLYGVELDQGQWRSFTRQIKLDAQGHDTPEWTQTYFDPLGRVVKIAYAAARPPYPCARWFYNACGQLERQVDPDGQTTLYQYNARGQLEYSAIDCDGNERIDLAGIDRLSRTVSEVGRRGGIGVRRTHRYVYPEQGSDQAQLAGLTETATDGSQSWQTTWNDGQPLTQSTQTRYEPATGSRLVTQTEPDGSTTTSLYRAGQLQSVRRQDAAGTLLSQTLYQYDPHGRLAQVIDARNGPTTFAYDAADQLVAQLEPPPAPGQPRPQTTFQYDPLGRRLKTVYPDGAALCQEYYPSGQLKRRWGARTYPVGYGYDAQGRLSRMTNWANFASGAGARVTTWAYNPYRGWLERKRYPDGTGPDYAYSPAGRLVRRQWARGSPRLESRYAYNRAGQLASVGYSDRTPAAAYAYDRQGRLGRVNRAGIKTTLTYNPAGQWTSEIYSGDFLDGLAVQSGYDPQGRQSRLAVQGASARLFDITYQYDPASRLQCVSDGVDQVTYSYLAGSSLIGQISFQSGAAIGMQTRNQYDPLNRLTSRRTSIGPVNQAEPVDQAAAAVSFSYHYNAAGQRDRVSLPDRSYWVYEYDALGQVKSGKKHWPDGAPVPGQQFEYSYDDIGNRTRTQAGGDGAGGGLRPSDYTANLLNQYTGRTVPGAVDIVGSAPVESTVTVNGLAADRHGDYYHRTLSVDIREAAQYLEVQVQAVNGGSSSNRTGRVFLPRTPEDFAYDRDGNLERDGRWVYSWDLAREIGRRSGAVPKEAPRGPLARPFRESVISRAEENRLVRMESLANAPCGSKRRLEFEYDWQGRRIRKTVSDLESGEVLLDNTFLYDGWNLVAEINSTNHALVRSYLWGLDLSGTPQGAGGVGGLLAVNDPAHGAHFVAHDGSGNVAALVSARDGTLSAQYEYGPFGEPIRVTGSLGKVNPFRWSTKYADDESDYLYYGYRYYNPSTGRWLSRDPIEEGGALNLYVFAGNIPNNYFDVLGMWTKGQHATMTTLAFNSANSSAILGSCAPALLQALINWNQDQDKGTNFQENRRHFNRDLNESVSAGRTDYSKYLSEESSRFNVALGGTSPSENACDNALQSLGRLIHSWQDYYAHAIVLVQTQVMNGAGFGGVVNYSIAQVPETTLWTASPPIIGSPDDPVGSNGAIAPSSWGSRMQPGEHGWSEVGGAEGNARQAAADQYIADKLKALVPQWYSKCKCHCNSAQGSK